MFADTAIIDYRSSFANQGKQIIFLFPFAANNRSLPFLRVQQTKENCYFLLVPISVYTYCIPYMLLFQYTYIYGALSNQKWLTESQAIFLNPFTVFSLIRLLGSSCKKFVACPYVDEETIGSHPFVNGLIGLNRLTHLC